MTNKELKEIKSVLTGINGLDLTDSTLKRVDNILKIIEREQLLRQGVSSSHTFEYRVIDHDMFDEAEIQTINSMGSKGWEIIRILEPIKWHNSDGMFVRIYYKREKLNDSLRINLTPEKFMKDKWKHQLELETIRFTFWECISFIEEYHSKYE